MKINSVESIYFEELRGFCRFGRGGARFGGSLLNFLPLKDNI
jgi:hypothetical protein